MIHILWFQVGEERHARQESLSAIIRDQSMRFDLGIPSREILIALSLPSRAKRCYGSQLIPGVVSRVDAHEAGPAPHENSVRHAQRGHTNRAPVSARHNCRRESIAQGS